MKIACIKSHLTVYRMSKKINYYPQDKVDIYLDMADGRNRLG